MLVVASDVHMTDRDTGAPVTDVELAAFVREVEGLEPHDEELTLLLLGDIIDFLRSEEWGDLWDNEGAAAPWSSLGQSFSGFEDSLQDERLLRIAARVEARYPVFSESLRRLKQTRQARVLYVVGNHDYMLQLSPKLRQHVVRFLSLDQDPADEFPIEYLDPKLPVYAEHGNRYDATNWHQRQAGLWAIGDAIVLRVVNRFGARARKALHLTDKTPLGQAVHEIDNVEPDLHIPLYVAWLAQTKLVSTTDKEKLLGCWRETVREFLALGDFQEDRYGKLATAIGWLRGLYDLFDVARLLQHLERIPLEIGPNYDLRAHLINTEKDLRVFGHTHRPGVHALPETDGQRRFYVNTGTWRRVISRVNVEKGQLDFAAHRVSSFLVVRSNGEFCLLSRCQVP